MFATLAAALLLAPVPQQAPASAEPVREDAVIPFVTRGTVRSFQPSPDDRGVYIQNQRRDWYFARFYTRCTELPSAIRIGFRTFGRGSTLQRGDTVLVGRDQCRIAGISRSGPPPRRAKRTTQR